MNQELLWKNVLAEIELVVSRVVFKTIFEKTHLLTLKDNIVTVSCPNFLVQQLIEGRYYSLLKDCLDRQTKKNTSLLFEIERRSLNKNAGPLFTINKTITPLSEQLKLKPDFTFENFAVSPSNQMAHAAAVAVSQNPSKAYNPLFLYGGVGVGKTHLMQAIAHLLLKQKPRLRIVYCTGEEFINGIIEAIRSKNTKRFKDRFRSARVLLIDDIQFIAGKNAVQEEFFHTFNAVSHDGGQIVLTSDQPPERISRLEERLCSRFEGGLTIDIAPATFELRAAIVLIKARQKNISLSMPVAQLLAANIQSIRKLEGTLNKLITQSQLKKQEITIELAKTCIGKKDPTALASVERMAPRDIVNAVASYFDLKTPALRGPKRNRFLALPRQVIMYLLRTDLNLGFVEIGQLLGGRDHTTIMYGVEKITTLLLNDHGLREDVSRIKERCCGETN